ncbi:hypothetical protein GCM10023161_19460 [Mycobacterium paraffinicum]|uniref:Uncharacterized protein n=1 Tax=Mycobacterium paraffinicum TaxID=53378 RepID=A0ABP8RIW7_9MYCO
MGTERVMVSGWRAGSAVAWCRRAPGTSIDVNDAGCDGSVRCGPATDQSTYPKIERKGLDPGWWTRDLD